MSKWISVNSAKVNSGRSEKIRGVQVNLFLPPYLIPEAVKGEYDQQVKRLVISFKYVDEDEERVPSVSSDSILRFLVGKKSRKIYEIQVDVDKAQATHVGLNINAIQNRTVQLLEKQGSELAVNTNVAVDIVKTQGKELFQPLSA